MEEQQERGRLEVLHGLLRAMRRCGVGWGSVAALLHADTKGRSASCSLGAQCRTLSSSMPSARHTRHAASTTYSLLPSITAPMASTSASVFSRRRLAGAMVDGRVSLLLVLRTLLK